MTDAARPFAGVDDDAATPEPYILTADGLYLLADALDPGGKQIRICSPIVVRAYARNAGSGQWSRLLAWTDPDGKTHEHVMPMSALQGDGLEICRFLSDGGLMLSPGYDARMALVEYLAASRPRTRITLANMTGWYRVQDSHVFVLADRTVGDIRGSEEVRFQSAGAAQVYVQAGTTADWRTQVAALCSGNSRLLLAIAAAFAAVLLEFTEIEGGGVHLLGASSSGKTTAALVAVSVFGDHRQMQRWRATGNGIEAIAAMYNGLLLVLDELGQVEPREAGEIAYMLANGQGKQRASRTGGAARRQSWRLLFLSTGEVGLSQHMASVGKQMRAGQEVRLVELQADAGQGHGLFDQLNGSANGAELSEALRAASRNFHGAVGLEFIQRAVKDADLLQQQIGPRIRDFVEARKVDFADLGEFGGQAYRVGERFALMAVAGELATEWGLTGLAAGEFDIAMKRCFGEWLKARGTAENSEPMVIVNTLRAFLSRNEESRFTDIDGTKLTWQAAPSGRTVYNRAGWRKKLFGTRREYFIEVAVFQKEIFAGHDVGLVCRVLNKASYLRAGTEQKQVRFALHRKVGADGRRRVYVVSDRIFDDDLPEIDADEYREFNDDDLAS